jgi:hypothetical protein
MTVTLGNSVVWAQCATLKITLHFYFTSNCSVNLIKVFIGGRIVPRMNKKLRLHTTDFDNNNKPTTVPTDFIFFARKM